METNTTQQIVKNFYEAKKPGNNGWKEMVTDDVTFKGTGMPSLQGKKSLIEITEVHLTRAQSSEIKQIFVEGDVACVTNNYNMVLSNGEKFTLETAEIVGVKNGKINSFDVYFDTVAFSSFMSKQK